MCGALLERLQLTNYPESILLKVYNSLYNFDSVATISRFLTSMCGFDAFFHVNRIFYGFIAGVFC